MFCNVCGAEVKEGTKFCINCGAELSVSEKTEEVRPQSMPSHIASGNGGAIAVIVIGAILAMLSEIAVVPVVLAILSITFKNTAKKAWKNGEIDKALGKAQTVHKLKLWMWITLGISVIGAVWGVFVLITELGELAKIFQEGFIA